MGGSSSIYTGGGGSGVQNACEGTKKFIIINTSDTMRIISTIIVNQEVHIVVDLSGTLPTLKVERIKDGETMGLVPANFSVLLNCINSGWKYEGKVVSINGSPSNPEILIEVIGA